MSTNCFWLEVGSISLARLFQSPSYRTTDRQSASLSWFQATIRARDQFFFSVKLSLDNCRFLILWRPLWREDGSVIYCCCWSATVQDYILLSQFFRLHQPGGPDPRIYIPPGTGWPRYIPGHWVPFLSPLTSVKFIFSYVKRTQKWVDYCQQGV
jgi:hypothetical protein